ncbi:MAG TPA: PKD domain-containing protein [Chitinophagaceae bacterium]|nr:PKD domain-containing protein [Chitinophagaceae bacterium]
MKKLYFILCGMALLSVKTSLAQMVPPDCFIKGDFVEVGISSTGAFGACNAPLGYHPNVLTFPGDLGFVSDPDQDGWLVSAPGKSAYMGDYFVPGSPYEAWDIEYAGTKRSASNCPTGAALPGAGTFGHVSYTASATEQRNVWSGTVGPLSITQTTVVKKNKLYFVMYVDIVNTSTATVNGVYYQRAVDPDNEQPWTTDFTTINKVVFQPNAISKNCLVTANGQVYSNSYLGLGTKDCRAKCYILNGGLSTNAQLSQLYAGTGAAAGNRYNIGATLTADVGYGLVFNLGSLAPGQRTSLAYTYILKQSDLDSALGETAPKFESDGVPYAPYTTFRVCPGKTVKLKLVNGGQYKWIWTAADTPNLMTAIGSSTLVPKGGTVPTVTGSKTFPGGAVYGDSVEVTVKGPKTYVATGYSDCDTQYMTFYVDTISFSTPPSVISPVRYCEGETAAALTAGAATGAILHWYDKAGTRLPAAPTPTTTMSAGAGDYDTTSYFVSQENAAGCETPKAKIDVIITRKPAPPVVKNLVYCQGDTTKMLDAPGTNNKWYDAATAGSKYPSPPYPSSATPTVLSFWVSQTVNGCESDRAQIDVEISAITAEFTTNKDSLCGAEVLAVFNNSKSTSTPDTYTSLWSFGDGGTRTDKDASHFYADARGTYTVTLDVENVHGCKDRATKVIEVFKVPVMSLSGSADKICQGDAVDFTGTATPGYSSLTWDFGDSDPAYNSLEVRHAFTKAGTFNVRLIGAYPACPETFASVPVDVVAIPNVNLGNDTGICPGNAPLTLYNITGAAVDKYMWSTGDTTPTIQVRNAGEYSVRVQNWQCSASDSITVRKACYLNVPNAFTPGSGNDYTSYFMPRDLMSQSVVTFSMQIYDRWGQLIFETDKVNGRGWDGKNKGADVPMGVYVYVIRVSFTNGVSESYDGNVTVLR